jgi:hypothetical protein
MSVDKLLLNLGTAPTPSATDSVVLREFSGGPIAQQDAEYNFINITDRVNKLIDKDDTKEDSITTIIDDLNTLDGKIQANTANIPVFEYNADTKTLVITSANA